MSLFIKLAAAAATTGALLAGPGVALASSASAAPAVPAACHHSVANHDVNRLGRHAARPGDHSRYAENHFGDPARGAHRGGHGHHGHGSNEGNGGNGSYSESGRRHHLRDDTRDEARHEARCAVHRIGNDTDGDEDGGYADESGFRPVRHHRHGLRHELHRLEGKVSHGWL